MYGAGISELLMIAVVGFILVGGGLLRRGGLRIAGPTLVLRSFTIDEAPSSNVLIDIVGRASGITAWLLTVIGLDAETTLKVTNKEVSFKSSSVAGQTNQVVPLPSVSSIHCGYSKSIGFLIIGAIIVLFSLVSGLGARDGGPVILVGLIIGGALLVAYYLSKKIVISIETSGGMVLGLSFKRSVIENVSVDMEQALQAIMILNRAVIGSQIK